MAPIESTVWGVDLGHSAVKGVLLSGADGTVKILRADIVALEQKVPQSAQEPGFGNRLGHALREFHARNHLDRHKVALAIPPQDTLTQDLMVHVVGKRRIEELVRFEAVNLLPFVLDEVVWGYHLFEETGESRARNGFLFAAKKTSIYTYIQLLQELGIEEIESVVPSHLAALNFLWRHTGAKGNAVLVDLGAHVTNIIAVDGARFSLRSVSRGANAFTVLLQERFNLSFEDAEKAKRNIARSRSPERLLEILKPELHGLFTQLRSGLDYFGSMGLSTEFDSFYMTGGGARLHGLKQQISENFDRQVQQLPLPGDVTISPEAKEAIGQNLDRFSTAVGAGLQCLSLGATTVNFMPPQLVRAAAMNRLKRRLLVPGVVVLAILLTLFFFGTDRRQALERGMSLCEEAQGLYEANLQDLRAAADRSLLQQELDYLSSLGRDKGELVSVFDELIALFQNANKKSPVRILLSSLRIRPGSRVVTTEEKRGEEADVSDKERLWLIVDMTIKITARGRIDAPKAYSYCKDRILTLMRASPRLTKTKGKASFVRGQKEVTTQDGNWSKTVHPGDSIWCDTQKQWYIVREITSDTALVLETPFAAADAESNYAVVRFESVQPDLEELLFQVRAVVPRSPSGAALKAREMLSSL